MVKLVNEVQPAKAKSQIRVTDAGIFKLVKELQQAQAQSPI